MAKKTHVKVRLVPEAKPDSPFFYYVKKPAGGEKAKIKLKARKYNPSTRKHETFVEKKHIAPDRSKELIKASKMSGLKNPSFMALATKIQSFSFYKTYFQIDQFQAQLVEFAFYGAYFIGALILFGKYSKNPE